MPITARDKARLAALFAVVKPPNSIAALLDNLSEEQRDQYDSWKSRCDRWIAQRPDGEAYAIMSGGYGPFDGLPQNIRTALFGQQPTIPITATEVDAVAIYNDYRGH